RDTSAAQTRRYREPCKSGSQLDCPKRFARTRPQPARVFLLALKRHEPMTTIKTELKPTVREIPADLETPVSAFLKLKGHGARFLLESVELVQNLGRYSIIGLDYLRNIMVLPDQVIVVEGLR